MANFMEFSICVICNIIFSTIKAHEETNYINNMDVIWFKMFDGCFSQKNKPIVMVRNWTHSVNLPIQTRRSIILLSIDELDRFDLYSKKTKSYQLKPNDPLFIPYPTSEFIISDLYTMKSMKLALFKMKYSIYWKQDGYFIIDNSKIYDSCSNAYLFLKTFWNFDILSVIYICRDCINGVYSYTFNPFSDRIPNFWTKEAIYKEDNGHPFTLFSRIFDISQGTVWLCDTFLFDKTSNLGGYPIKLIGFPIEKVNPLIEKSRGIKIRGLSGDNLNIIWNRLNGTVVLEVSNSTARGIIDKDGIPSGIIGDVLNGKYDMLLNTEFQRNIWKNELNSFVSSGVCYVVKRNSINVKKIIFAMLTNEIWFKLILTYVSIVLILKYLLKKSYKVISFEIVRAITGVGILYEPHSTIHRFLFIVFVFSFMWVSFQFQGKLSSLETAPEYSLDIKIPVDLVRHKYKIYSEKQYYHNFFGTTFENYVEINNKTDECIDWLKYETKIACVIDCLTGKLKVPIKKNILIMENFIWQKYYVWLMRDDFPLRKSINSIQTRLASAGIPELIKLRNLHRMMLNRIENIELDESKKYVITIIQISYAFSFLRYGFFISTLCFLTELFLYYMNIRTMHAKIIKLI